MYHITTSSVHITTIVDSPTCYLSRLLSQVFPNNNTARSYAAHVSRIIYKLLWGCFDQRFHINREGLESHLKHLNSNYLNKTIN